MAATKGKRDRENMWVVCLSFERPEGLKKRGRANEKIFDALTGRMPILVWDNDVPSLMFDVCAQDAQTALSTGVCLLEEALAQAGLFVVSIVGMRVETESALMERAGKDGVRELMGEAEVALFLGISKSRLAALKFLPGFPPPMARLAATSVWNKAAVEQYVRETRGTTEAPPQPNVAVLRPRRPRRS